MRSMKDSGIEWIGMIPENWDVSLLKHSIQWKSDKGYPDATVLSLYREYGIVPKESRDDNHNVTSLDTSTYKHVDIGDLVVNKMKAWQGSLAVSGFEGIVSPAYHVCRITNEQINKMYLHYLLRNTSYLPEYKRLSTGMRIGQWDLGFEDFKNIPFVIPPLYEQERIVNYLDYHCTLITELIENTKASIEEYKKLKLAFITQAVTKGVRANRPVKNSGVDYVGSIPKEWDCCKLKYIINSLGSGTSVTATELNENSGYPVYGGGQLINYYSQYNMEDTLVIGRVGANCGCITRVYGKAWATDNALIVKTDFPIDYLYYVLVAANLNKLNTSNAQPLITSGKVLNQKVPICWDKSEQDTISRYLNDKCNEIDAIVEKKKQLITELEELKRSMIFELVTGKKEIINADNSTKIC